MSRGMIVLLVAAVFSLAAIGALAFARYRDMKPAVYTADVSLPRPGAAPQAAGSGCGGGCCSRRPGADIGAERAAAAEKMAREYYGARYGDDGIAVQVKDFGCHMEAYILKGDRMVKRLTINGNSVNES